MSQDITTFSGIHRIKFRMIQNHSNHLIDSLSANEETVKSASFVSTSRFLRFSLGSLSRRLLNSINVMVFGLPGGAKIAFTVIVYGHAGESSLPQHRSHFDFIGD